MILTNKDIQGNLIEKADVCIIGSGAGGAVLAKEIAEAGLKVIVLEEGGYYTSKNYPEKRTEVTKLLYRDAGSTTAIGMPMIMIPLGRCVGGTTVINSGTCFRIPQIVLRHWQSEFGLESITIEKLSSCYEKVEKIINVTETPENLLGGSGIVIKRGAEKLGLRSGPITRNVRNCEGCGICAFGCPTDAKQAMHVSYIPLASKMGATIYANTRAEKLIVEDGTILGVEALVLDNNDVPTVSIKVRSKITIVSCGAIFSPILLMKNKILRKSKHLGKHLHIHPATRVVALFDEKIEGWKGVPQSYRIEEFLNQGIMMEGFFVPPNMGAGTLPFVGIKHKEIMFNYKNIASFGVMVSDITEGSVGVNFIGSPYIRYSLNDDDTKKLLKGIATIADVFLAAGAKEVYTGLIDVPVIRSTNDINQIYKKKIPPSHLELMAFHPMGTARMGKSIEDSVVGQDCESHEVKNLYIVDASIFPTSLGVNPQLTIMAFATLAVEEIIKKLK